MIAFSKTEPDELDGITTSNIRTLLRVVSNLELRRTAFVEARYKEEAPNFESTLEFVRKLGWIAEIAGELSLRKEGKQASSLVNDDDMFRCAVLRGFVAMESPYSRLLEQYLLKFEKHESQLIYSPSLMERLKESSFRNFLIELGIVSYEQSIKSYVLEDQGIELYLRARNLNANKSREQARMESQYREELGYRAELAVLDYERERVGSEYAERVEHVSAKIPFASYDIKSVSLEHDNVSSRFIEVKACPAYSYQFYWSASELESARLLRGKYHIYLLPVSANGEFNLGTMLIIQDPVVSVYQNPESWVLEENVIICRKI